MALRRRDEVGAIAPLTAVLLVVLFGFGALAVDLGRMHLERRSLQAAVDSAALSAVRAPMRAGEVAGQIMARHGYAAASISVTTGQFLDDPAVVIQERFVSGGEPHAVQVSAKHRLPWALAQVLVGPGEVDIGATAVAVHQPVAAFALGSGAARLEAGVLNQLLGTVLGGNVALTAADYVGLANANISLFRFVDALAVRSGLSAGTYDELLDMPVTVGNLLDVAAEVLGASDSVARSSLSVLSQAALSGRSLRLGDLLGLSVHQARQAGTFGAGRSYAEVGLNALDLVTAAATLGGSDSAIALSAPIRLPGIASVDVRLRLIEPPVSFGGGMLELGPVGATAQTQQVRVLLVAELKAALPMVEGDANITLPILVEAAPAVAELTSVSCQGDPASDSEVDVRAATGVVRAQIGSVGLETFADPTADLQVLAPAPLATVRLKPLGLPLVDVRVLGSAALPIGSGSETLHFSAADITGQQVRTVSSGGVAAGLGAALAERLVLSTDASLLGVQLPNLGPLLNGVTAALRPVLLALDPVLEEVLAGLGLRIGFVDVRVSGVACGNAMLVR